MAWDWRNRSLLEEPDGADAVFSADGRFRYNLCRRWRSGPTLCWLMLNPSMASATVDDPTLRRCLGFSNQWGYGSLVVINLFALRATDVRELARAEDPVGPRNNQYIRAALATSAELICAWGSLEHLTADTLRQRPAAVLKLVPAGMPVCSLGLRKDGAPRHPLMLRADTLRQPFPPR